jgi:hypothetical protein
MEIVQNAFPFLNNGNSMMILFNSSIPSKGKMKNSSFKIYHQLKVLKKVF